MRRTSIAACVLGLILAACGGGSEVGAGDRGLGDDQQSISDAIFSQIMADDSPDNPFGQPEARCFSDGVAREFGSDELTALGLSADEINAGAEPGDVSLSDAQADRMTTLMVDCVDFKTLFVDEFTASGVSAESAECLADGFGDDFVKTVAKSELIGGEADPFSDPALSEDFFSLLTSCLSFEELTQLGEGG